MSEQADALKAQALECLKQNFGHGAFRGKQWEAIQAIVNGRDTLVLMPTGGGKTLCYAVPAMLIAGLTLVVSPLIALVQDQVRSLTTIGIRAAFLNSSQTAAEQKAVREDAVHADSALKMLYVTPELLAGEMGQALLKQVALNRQISFLAVDEAHCISSWGHDFRPAYRQLSSVRRLLKRLSGHRVPVMALTATANPEVRKDIVSSLSFENGIELVSSFNRPNIQYSVTYVGADLEHEARLQVILQLLGTSRNGGKCPCAIIYALKRDHVEVVAEKLQAAGVPAVAYHAGVKDRAQVLEAFLAGTKPVVVATIAFGMGIDKADVRFVIHYNVPKSIAAFYQESGRAGRDGQPCRSVVCLTHEDLRLMNFLADKEDKQGEAKAKHAAGPSGGSQSAASSSAKFAELEGWCMTCHCRRSTLLQHLGEASGPCRMRAENELCDVCRDPSGTRAALDEFRSSKPSALGGTHARLQEEGEDVFAHALLRGDLAKESYADSYNSDDADDPEQGKRRKKRRRQADSDSDDGGKSVRARLGAGDLSDGDSPRVRVKAAPKDITAEHRAKIRSWVASVLAEKSESLGSRQIEAAPVAEHIDDCLFHDCINKTGYYGRARSFVAHVKKASNWEELIRHPDHKISQLLGESTADGQNSTAEHSVPRVPFQLEAASGQGSRSMNGAGTSVSHHQHNDPTKHSGTSLRLIEETCAALERVLPMPTGQLLRDGAVEPTVKEQACKVLQTLKSARVTVAMLQESPVAKRVRKYTKHPDSKIAAAAAAVISSWKSDVQKERQAG